MFWEALEKKLTNPEFSLGLLITLYRLQDKASTENTIHLLRQATELEPDNWYINILLALTLQPIKKEAEGDDLVDENTKPVRPNITEIKALWTQS